MTSLLYKQRLLLICVVGLLIMIILPNVEYLPDDHRTQNQKRFDMIRLGMSEPQLTAMLGSPGYKYKRHFISSDEIVGYSNPDGSFGYYWFFEDCEITVRFTKTGIVCKKEISPAPAPTSMELVLAFIKKHFLP